MDEVHAGSAQAPALRFVAVFDSDDFTGPPEPPLVASSPRRQILSAPRDGAPRRAGVLVAALDLDQRRDWLAAFPFARARRPDVYG